MNPLIVVEMVITIIASWREKHEMIGKKSNVGVRPSCPTYMIAKWQVKMINCSEAFLKCTHNSMQRKISICNANWSLYFASVWMPRPNLWPLAILISSLNPMSPGLYICELQMWSRADFKFITSQPAMAFKSAFEFWIDIEKSNQ